MKISQYLLGTLSACGCVWFVVCFIWFRRWLFTNLANIITGLGIKVCCGLLWLVIFYPEQTYLILASAGFVVFTDWIDGKVARYFENKGYEGSVSNFGKGLDRFRDKFFQITMCSYFLPHQGVDYFLKWAIGPCIFVEIFLLLILVLGMKNKTDVSAGHWGKTKMVLACVGILACMVIIMVKEHGVKISQIWAEGIFVIFLFSLFCAVMSFAKHVAKYRAQIKSM